MNVKTLTSNIVTPLENLKNTDTTSSVKSQETSDRDADGRRQQDPPPEKGNLTEEELNQILTALQNHSGIKDNQLVVKHKFLNNTYFFTIEDTVGKVVRRMNTNEAWILMKTLDQKTGHLLNKAL